MARPRRSLILALILWFASSVFAASPPLRQPNWSELSSEQQSILAPLANEWAELEGFRRKKWLGIAQRYKEKGPEEQSRIQQRMRDWAKLTPEERKHARDKYLALKSQHPEKKDAVKQKWQEYKDLPDGERARIHAEAQSKPLPKPGRARVPVVKAKPPSDTITKPTASSQNDTPGLPSRK